ncbi:hypothetical protein ONZ45_g14368 [Pleurotus djamor]|nr:hypothetical protein ONZ45_g14368 [Pleurotus djamor]
MLGRCKDVPLTIECDFKLVPPSFDVTHFLAAASQQIQALKLKFTNFAEMVSISLALSHLPMLKSFVLNVRWSLSMGNSLNAFQWPNAPALRRLELNVNGRFPHNRPPVFPSLVKLLLSATVVPMSWFVKVLHGAPSLELADASVTTQEGSHSATIHLPKLRNLSLAMDNIAGVILFNHLDIPVCTSISVSAHVPISHMQPSHLSILQGLISRYPSTDQGWSRFAVNLDFYARRVDLVLEVDIDLFDDDLLDDDDDDLPPQLCIRLPMEPTIAPHYELCSMLPLDKIQTLDLSFEKTPDTRVIPNILPLFSHLHALECDLHIPSEILNCLIDPVDGDGSIPNPRLAKLSLTTLEAESEFLALINILQQRKNLGHPIRKVSLMGPKKPPRCIMARLSRVAIVKFFEDDSTDSDEGDSDSVNSDLDD